MIYSKVKDDDPISQGDIFVNIPRVDVSFKHIVRGTSDGFEKQAWTDVVACDADNLVAVFPMKIVSAIVVSQDCDASRAQFITLCEIVNYVDTVLGGANSTPKTAKKWADVITKRSRENPRFFYLPIDEASGLKERQAVDFRHTIRLLREELDETKSKSRIGNLNKYSRGHFREAISNFFRRYSYDEWYSLDAEEFQNYQSRPGYEDTEPFPWQT